jgi:ribosomal protein S18 acetylase RimI-like enzyme
VSPPALSLTKCYDLPAVERRQAAVLAAEAMPILYDPVGSQAIPMLAAEFLLPDGELGQAVAVVGGEVDGLVAAYPAADYADRQRTSLHHALGNLDRVGASKMVAALRDLSGEVPSEGLNGVYIARFTVRSALRGSGLADRLMETFVADRPLATLHVSADNVRAISFYRRHGFEERSRSRSYLLLKRAQG